VEFPLEPGPDVEIAEYPTLWLVPKLSPQFGAPFHLGDWCGILDRAAEGEPIRAINAEPIRHWKSRTTWHGAIKILLRDPTCPVIYFTHSHQKAQDTGKAIRDLAESCDRQFGTNIGPNRGKNTIEHWSNDRGGGVLVMSAEQSRLGYDCGALIADDPIDELGAYSLRVRDTVDDALAHYTARCMRGGKPGPVMIVASPWHPDDPMGRRKGRTAKAWQYLTHPAIIDEGLETERAFAHAVWPLEALKEMRAELAEKDPTERIWWAQLMCQPRPPGGGKFGDPHRYNALPDTPFRIAYGCDFAFTQGEGSDYFALVVAQIHGRKVYIVDVQRHKIDAHQIESTLKAAQNKYGRGVIWSYQSGPEIGLSNLLIERGVPVGRMPARFNKLVRAERTARRWNDGDIYVPNNALWTGGFLGRMASFRGAEKDGDDDEVDALVSLCDGALGGATAAPRTTGKPGYSGL
jgi:predicted phage terminase large subunit-like protein